jgi:nucleoside-diphosphate-sugar epimerase
MSANRTALVIGGTGPTGPIVVRGLLTRGYDISILHRGWHEDESIPPEVRHIHADPFDEEAFTAALAGRQFDVVISSYGRLRMIANVMAGKTHRVVAIGGSPVFSGWFAPEINFPAGFPVPVPENFPRAANSSDADHSLRTARAEREFLAHIEKGEFSGTILRFPYVYGPRQIQPREWSIIRRILDGRRAFVLPAGGRVLSGHGYSENMAHSVLLAVDSEAAGARGYNCGDQQIFTKAQWIEIIAAKIGVQVEILMTPDIPGHPTASIVGHRSADHRVLDVRDIETELGYADVVDPKTAIGRTTEWYLANPIERGSELEKNLQDHFAYELEDKFIELSRNFERQLTELALAPARLKYDYSTRPKPIL